MGSPDIKKLLEDLERRIADLEKAPGEGNLNPSLIKDAVNEGLLQREYVTHRDVVAAKARTLLAEGKFAELEEFLAAYRAKLG